MHNILKIAPVLLLMTLVTGCETAHKATQQTGTYVGKGAGVVGGVTEGVTQGYAGTNSSQENPYGR